MCQFLLLTDASAFNYSLFANPVSAISRAQSVPEMWWPERFERAGFTTAGVQVSEWKARGNMLNER